MATIREVASLADVSPATVSRVMNGMSGFSTETRDRVRQAVEQLGYQPDHLARGLRTANAQLLGVLAPKVSSAFAFEVMEGVEAVARDHGYSVMLGRTGFGSLYSCEYLRTMRAYRAVGVVLISAVITDEFRHHLGPNRPLVSVAISDRSGTPSIAIDDEQAGHDAVAHLLSLGHRSLGIIAGDPSSIHVGAPRLAGAVRAAREAGIEPVVVHGDFFYESGARAIEPLLAASHPVTAIFAVSDEMAVGAINELQRRGYEVPRDISVVGFDDTSAARQVHPQLTTVAQPLRAMGELAATRLLRSRDLTSSVMPHRLVVRASAAPPSACKAPLV